MSVLLVGNCWVLCVFSVLWFFGTCTIVDLFHRIGTSQRVREELNVSEHRGQLFCTESHLGTTGYQCCFLQLILSRWLMSQDLQHVLGQFAAKCEPAVMSQCLQVWGHGSQSEKRRVPVSRGRVPSILGFHEWGKGGNTLGPKAEDRWMMDNEWIFYFLWKKNVNHFNNV